MKTRGFQIYSFFFSLLALTSSAAATSAERSGRGPRLVPVADAAHVRDVRDIVTVGDRVVVATSGGVAVHQRSDGAHLFTLNARHGLSGNSATAVGVDSRGDVVVGCEFGTSRLRGISGARSASDVRVASVLTGARADRFDPVIAIHHRNGELFVVSQRSGPRRFNSRTVSLEERPFGEVALSDAVPSFEGWRLAGMTGQLVYQVRGTTRESVELGEPILAIADDEPHTLIATGERLLRLSAGRVQELRSTDRSGPVRAVAFSATHGQEVLVATREGEILTVLDGTLTPITHTERQVQALHADGATLWVGLSGEGLGRVELDEGTLHAGLSPDNQICSNHVTQLTRHSGHLVAASFDQGACYQNGDDWIALATPSPFVHGIASDGFHLYVATSNGIARFGPDFSPAPIDRKTPRVLRWLKDTAATGASEIAPGRVALSSAYGVAEIRRRRGRTRVTFHDRSKGTVPLSITKLAGVDGEIFVASETQGVSRMGLSEEGPRRYLDPVELPEAWVTAISASAPTRLWVGTCQSGIALIDRDRVLRVSESQGLPDDRVTAVESRDRGAFVGTLWGLAYVDSDGNVTPYRDGIPDPRSSAVFRDGETLWLGTESGLVAFRLEEAPIVMAKAQ